MGGNRNLTTILILLGIHLVLQIFVFRLLVPYDAAFCFLYVSFLLMLPLDVNPMLALAIAFGTGLFVDVFENTLGINAAASVFTMYVRPHVLKMIFGQNGTKEEINGFVSIPALGLQGYLFYGGVLVFGHCVIFFIAEAANVGLFFQNFDKVIYSTIYTLSLVVISQMLIFSPRFQR